MVREAIRKIRKYADKLFKPMRGSVYWHGYKHMKIRQILDYMGEVGCENAYEWVYDIFIHENKVPERLKGALLEYARMHHKRVVPFIRAGKITLALFESDTITSEFLSRRFPKDLLLKFQKVLIAVLLDKCRKKSYAYFGEHRIKAQIRVSDNRYNTIIMKGVIKH